MRARKRSKMISKPQVIKTFVLFLFKTRRVCKRRLIHLFVAEIGSQLEQRK